jgi:hypothetical protein
MSSNAFMPPALPQTHAPNLNRAPGKSSAAFKSNRLGESADQRESFSATLNRISDRKHQRNSNSTAAKKPALRSRGSDTESIKPKKMSKTNAQTRDDIEENGAHVSGKESRPIHPWLAFGLMPYHLMNGSVAAGSPSDSTTGSGLRMLTDLIGRMQSHGQKANGEWVGIGPFEQLQANISPEALNRIFFKQLAAWGIHHQDSGNLTGNPALDGILNGQPGSSGANVNAPLNPLLHMLGMTGAAWGLKPDTSGSGLEAAHLNEDLLLKMTTPSHPTESGISENAKMALAGPEGRLPFWAPGDSNSETLLEAQARKLSENSQTLKNQVVFKAAAQQTDGITAKTPEEVFGIKSAVPNSEILPMHALDNKISRIDGDSKDSSFLFSQDQMPQDPARLENAAQRSEAARRGLMSQTLNQIVQKAVLSFNNGQHEVQIDLKPDFLGHIRMQIITESQQVAVRIVAELPFVKDMLESNLNQLKAELQAQGLKVDELEVSVAHDSRADDDQHQKATEARRARALKNSRLSDNAATEEQTDVHTGRGDGIAETAIDYFA